VSSNKSKRPGYPRLAKAIAVAMLGAGALYGCGPTGGDLMMGDMAVPDLPDAATPGPDAGDLVMGVAPGPDLPPDPDLPPGGVP
jgi:hypothetical protein